MSILIRGMKMPTSCQHCFASDDESRFCRAANEYIPMLGKPKFCPLVPVPPHGRLIDGDVAEVITYTNESGDFADGILYAADWIAEQPTIIEAEEGE